MRFSILTAVFTAAVLCGADGAGAWTWPTRGPVLKPFVLGSDPYASGQHRGTDVGAEADEDVLAPASGTVSFAGTVPSGGKTVTIETAGGLSVTLVHLAGYSVRRGDEVREGAAVGSAGVTPGGEWPRPYVHLGVRRTSDKHGYLDPLTLLPPRSTPAPVVAPAAPAPSPSPAPVPSAPQSGAAPAPKPTPAPEPAPTPAAPLAVPAPATTAAAALPEPGPAEAVGSIAGSPAPAVAAATSPDPAVPAAPSTAATSVEPGASASPGAVAAEPALSSDIVEAVAGTARGAGVRRTGLSARAGTAAPQRPAVATPFRTRGAAPSAAATRLVRFAEAEWPALAATHALVVGDRHLTGRRNGGTVARETARPRASRGQVVVRGRVEPVAATRAGPGAGAAVLVLLVLAAAYAVLSAHRRRRGVAVVAGAEHAEAPLEPMATATCYAARCRSRPTLGAVGRQRCSSSTTDDPLAALLAPPRRRAAPVPVFRGRRGRSLARAHAVRRTRQAALVR